MTEENKPKSAVTHFKISKLIDGMRLDKVLREKYATATFGVIQKLCRKGQIRLDGKRVKGNERVAVGQEVRVPPFLTTESEDIPKMKTVYHLTTKEKHDIENMILFENDEMIVLNKPFGLPVQAGTGHSKSVDRMLAAYVKEDEMAKLVHRIDKTTTGCLLLAKTRAVAQTLSNAFKNRKVKKTYWAIVEGKVREHEYTIKTPIEVQEKDGKEKMGVRKNKGGFTKMAETSYKVLDSAGMYHLLEVYPKTGRKHQIRVHLADIGLPIVGDIKYGGKRMKGDGDMPSGKLFLHARSVDLGQCALKRKFFQAEAPEHFKSVFDIMEWKVK